MFMHALSAEKNRAQPYRAAAALGSPAAEVSVRLRAQPCCCGGRLVAQSLFV